MQKPPPTDRDYRNANGTVVTQICQKSFTRQDVLARHKRKQHDNGDADGIGGNESPVSAEKMDSAKLVPLRLIALNHRELMPFSVHTAKKIPRQALNP